VEREVRIEKTVILKVTADLRMIAFNEQSGTVITWGSAAESDAIASALKTLGFTKVKMQA